MHIKWIVCEIKNSFEKEFSTAQEQWIETQNSVGFIGQVGGWDLNHNKTACIISFWKNRDSLNLFMIRYFSTTPNLNTMIPLKWHTSILC
jgi:hypothetical protein